MSKRHCVDVVASAFTISIDGMEFFDLVGKAKANKYSLYIEVGWKVGVRKVAQTDLTTYFPTHPRPQASISPPQTPLLAPAYLSPIFATSQASGQNYCHYY